MFMNARLITLLITAMTILMVGAEIFAQEEKKTEKEKSTTEAKQAQTKQQPAKPGAAQKEPVATEKKQEESSSLLNVEMQNIDGEKINLKKYQGKVVLIVNVASKCGFTGQYRPLQALHKKYQQHGLEVVAFPCNQFGRQEPADEATINKFCAEKFGIEFDMYAKVEVKGKKQVELFRQLTKSKLAPAGKGDIRWNFEKFLIDKEGKPIARFRSNVSPDDEAIVSKIKAALGMEGDTKKEVAKSARKETVRRDKKTEPVKTNKLP